MYVAQPPEDVSVTDNAVLDEFTIPFGTWVEQGVGLQGVQAEYARGPLASSTLVEIPEGIDWVISTRQKSEVVPLVRSTEPVTLCRVPVVPLQVGPVYASTRAR